MKSIRIFLLFALVGLAFPLSAQEVGLQLYSLREQFKTDVPGTLKTIGELGIEHLEGGGTYGLSEADFKELLVKNGLRITSLGASYEELRSDPEAVAKKALRFGASYVMCSWIPHDGDIFGISEVEKALEVFNKAGESMKKNGLVLVYHPHGYEFRPYQKGTLFDHMAVNSKNFDFEMDIYWVKQAGVDPLQLLRKYPEQFLLMHLKDRAHGTMGNPNGRGDVETNVVLGTGDVDVKSLLLEAKKLKIKYLFIEDESSRVLKQLPKSLEYAEKILEQ
ncbi:MAG: sugar phosphate isomerase/epimerase [Sediminicola sp.]